MATLTITIADGKLPDVLDSIARARAFTGTDRTGAPETQTQFARRMIVEQLQIWTAIGHKMDIDEQISDANKRQPFGIS